MQGKIIKGIAGFYYVYGEDEVLYECNAKGIFRKDNQKPLVGDNVEITILDQQESKTEFYASGPFPDHDGTGRGSGSDLL